MKKQNIVTLSLAACVLAGCGTASPVGTVDVQRIVANWPQYKTYQSQLLSEEQSLAAGKGSNAQKQRAAQGLQQKYAGINDQLTQQIRDAAAKVAAQRSLKLVFTREGVGYGGVDITSDVEKAMNITEKATPTPGS